MFKYFYGALVVGFIYLVGSTVYESMTKKDFKSSRLACQKESVTIETFRKPEKVRDAIKALKSGNYELKSKIKFSKYMVSSLGKYLSVKDVDNMMHDAIAAHHVKSSLTDCEVLIDYFVYENDKEDPGKKTAKSKLYAGFIYLNFKLKGESVYDVQIDYKDLKAKDLAKRIDCAIASFLSSKNLS